MQAYKRFWNIFVILSLRSDLLGTLMNLLVHIYRTTPIFFQVFRWLDHDLFLFWLASWTFYILTFFSSVARVWERLKHNDWDRAVANMAVLESRVEITWNAQWTFFRFVDPEGQTKSVIDMSAFRKNIAVRLKTNRAGLFIVQKVRTKRVDIVIF